MPHISHQPGSSLKRVRWWIEYAVVVGSSGYVRLWPRWAVMAGAGVMGWIAYFVLGHDRRVAMANLEFVFGASLTRRQKRRMARGAFVRAARTIIGLLWLPRLAPGGAAGLLEGREALDPLRRMSDRGQGLILVTAHYGDWELLCYAAAACGFTMLMVTEPLRNPLLDRFISNIRAKSGNRIIPPRHAAIKLLRGLKAGERVAMMVDVNGRRGRGGVWCDFFGLPVFNGSAMAELALRSGAAIVFAAAAPAPGGRTRLVCRDPIRFIPATDHAADIRRLTQQVLDQCRELIQSDPRPWLWTYKRWKRRPTAAQGPFPFYSRHLPGDDGGEPNPS